MQEKKNGLNSSLSEKSSLNNKSTNKHEHENEKPMWLNKEEQIQLEEENIYGKIQLFRWRTACLAGPSLYLLSIYWTNLCLPYSPILTLQLSDIGEMTGSVYIAHNEKRKPKSNIALVKKIYKTRAEEIYSRTKWQNGFLFSTFILYRIYLQKKNFHPYFF